MKNAKKTILHIKLGFLALFVVLSAGILIYGALYEMPRRKCESQGQWWNDKYRSCETPIYLPIITGRKPGEPRQIVWPSKDAAMVSNPEKTEAQSSATAKSGTNNSGSAN
jgi:hypothetical protein